MIKKKSCSKCGKEKSLTEFYIDRRAKDSHRSICKECARAYKKGYYRIYPEESVKPINVR